ncbi:ParB/RepB/Spo0J family partition protein [Rothia similmucilaginosa]|uniref:ParB/RepB/Spo0J family partition protein n=1 Tax=unclassified Rothia (in: high G+C Gram-positive bacteria) TaxID=2689056 RepID=UPI0024475F4D|nr:MULTISPECIES: ParB/RepB/Spo0J family partition protein [unclassified Rothia (in: high G+C Gram-positive bacteria)]
MAEKRRGLGRGLGALIPQSTKNSGNAEAKASEKTAPKKASTPIEEPMSDGLFEMAHEAKPEKQRKSAKAESVEDKPAEAVPAQEKPVEVQRVEEKVEAPASSQNVSRETLKKKSRVDMGAALRNTTLTRRPVDFFFGEDVSTPQSASEERGGLVPVPGAQFAELNVRDIHPNRKQPRTDFDEQDMEELIHSVREIGVLQPIVVRPSRENGAEKYELVMGERRWRATQAAGLSTIPAIVRETEDGDLLRDALLENLHRSQLNPIEEAAAYQQLMEEFDTTQEQLAKRIGRSRPQISNTIRLLKLPALVQRRVAAGILSAGHARALLSLTDQAQIETLAQKIVNEGLSVRATEELVNHASGTAEVKERKTPQPQKHRERLDYIAEAFADKLDTSVKISLGARKGKMTIEFANVEDLNRIIRVLDSDFSG